MTKVHRFSALTMVAVLFASMFVFAAKPAQADNPKTWDYATYGLGALAAYSLLKGKTTQGLVLGAGAAYTYSRARKARRENRYDSRYDRRSNDRYYDDRYDPYEDDYRYNRRR